MGGILSFGFRALPRQHELAATIMLAGWLDPQHSRAPPPHTPHSAWNPAPSFWGPPSTFPCPQPNRLTQHAIDSAGRCLISEPLQYSWSGRDIR